MKGKLFTLVVFAMIAALGFASALTMTVSNDLGASQNATINLVNNDAFAQTVTFSPASPFTDSSGIVYSFPSSVSLGASQSKSVPINVSIVPSGLKFGKYSFTLNANGVDPTNSSNNVSTSTGVAFDQSFCRQGTVGNNLTITSVDIRDTASGSDDTSWTLLDTVTVKVRVENIGDNTVRSVITELGLYDSNGVNRVGDLTFSNSNNEKITYGSIKSGNDATITFQFQVPASLNSGTYKLAVKAYSNDIGQNYLCSDTSSDLDSNTYQSIDVNTQDSTGKYIAFDNIQLSPTDSATCGDTVTLTTTAYNIGDQDEDRVRVTAFNQELGLSSYTDISGGMAQGDSAPLTYTFTIPQNAQNHVYPITLYADYEYNNGVYTQRSTNPTQVSLNVIGCQSSAQTSQTNVSLAASLTSSAVAGQPLDVSTTITNTGSSLASYTLDATGYDSWATLSSISSRLVTLDGGQSKQVTFELVPNNNAAGQQSFVISATGANSVVTSKEVVVNLAASSGFSLGSLSGSGMIWIIAAVNVVLLLIIIFVAVKLSRR